MSWQIEFKPRAEKALEKLDRQTQQRIQSFLNTLRQTENPRLKGAALHGEHGLWKYRIGDYRLVARIQDQQLIVLVIHLGHRREVYRSL